MDGSKCNCPELEVDTLADRQPVQLRPQFSGTETTWRLSDHTGEQVLDTLKAVEVVLGSAIEQAVTVVKTCTDDTHCNRLGSIECQSWTDVAQGTDMKVAGTDDTMESAWWNTMPRSMTVSENWRLVPATLTPPAVSALLSLNAVPNTTASVLDGFNIRPFSRNQWVMSSVQLIN